MQTEHCQAAYHIAEMMVSYSSAWCSFTDKTTTAK